MARAVTWFPRMLGIYRSVANSTRTHYDRREIERLFQVQPRTAQKLMGAVEGIRIGRSQLICREALEAFLEKLVTSEDPAATFRAAHYRVKERRSRRLRIQLTDEILSTTLDSLPDGITFKPGHLSFQGFASSEELLGQLWSFISALQNDEDRIKNIADQTKPELPNEVGKDREWLELELAALKTKS